MIKISINKNSTVHDVIVRLKKEERQTLPQDVELTIGDCSEMTEYEFQSIYFFLKYTNFSVNKIITPVNPNKQDILICLSLLRATELNEIA